MTVPFPLMHSCRFPSPGGPSNQFYTYLAPLVGVLLACSFTYPFACLVR